jgi:hypothetical protein
LEVPTRTEPGAAAGGTGLAFLGHYVYLQTRSLRPDQKVEGGNLDLALGAGLTVSSPW